MRSPLTIVFAFAFSGAAYADQTACEASYQSSGTFLSSRNITVSDTFADVSTDQLFRRVDLALVKDGEHINQADREVGVISASQASACLIRAVRTAASR